MPTIKDVAERAGVSTATVSYVLNGTGVVTEATRQRVLAAVAELNYQPNYAARTLRSRSRTVGLVLPAHAAHLADPARSELLAGLSEAAAARGYYLLLATAGADQPDYLLGEQLVRSGRVDGLVLLDVQTDDERAHYLYEHRVPHICAGPPPEELPCPFVTVDGRGGAVTAMQHLLGLGHRRIGLVMLPSDLSASGERYQGYVEALNQATLEFDPLLAVEAGPTQDDGVTAMQELLDRPDPPTAVLACSDELAFGVMHALDAARLETGRDVSVIGFDDLPMAAHTRPPLTTLRYPRQLMGRRLASLLIDQIEGQPPVERGVTLEMRLIIRRSTGPATPIRQ